MQPTDKLSSISTESTLKSGAYKKRLFHLISESWGGAWPYKAQRQPGSCQRQPGELTEREAGIPLKKPILYGMV